MSDVPVDPQRIDSSKRTWLIASGCAGAVGGIATAVPFSHRVAGWVSVNFGTAVIRKPSEKVSRNPPIMRSACSAPG